MLFSIHLAMAKCFARRSSKGKEWYATSRSIDDWKRYTPPESNSPATPPSRKRPQPLDSCTFSINRVTSNVLRSASRSAAVCTPSSPRAASTTAGNSMPITAAALMHAAHCEER